MFSERVRQESAIIGISGPTCRRTRPARRRRPRRRPTALSRPMAIRGNGLPSTFSGRSTRATPRAMAGRLTFSMLFRRGAGVGGDLQAEVGPVTPDPALHVYQAVNARAGQSRTRASSAGPRRAPPDPRRCDSSRAPMARMSAAIAASTRAAWTGRRAGGPVTEGQRCSSRADCRVRQCLRSPGRDVHQQLLCCQGRAQPEHLARVGPLPTCERDRRRRRRPGANPGRASTSSTGRRQSCSRRTTRTPNSTGVTPWVRSGACESPMRP